jgi:hypothetical protein
MRFIKVFNISQMRLDRITGSASMFWSANESHMELKNGYQ